MKRKAKRGPITKRPQTEEFVPGYIRGNAQRGAFKKGVLAYRAGKTKERSNPYSKQHATFERGLYLKFIEGFEYAEANGSDTITR